MVIDSGTWSLLVLSLQSTSLWQALFSLFTVHLDLISGNGLGHGVGFWWNIFLQLSWQTGWQSVCRQCLFQNVPAVGQEANHRATSLLSSSRPLLVLFLHPGSLEVGR